MLPRNPSNLAKHTSTSIAFSNSNTLNTQTGTVRIRAGSNTATQTHTRFADRSNSKYKSHHIPPFAQASSVATIDENKEENPTPNDSTSNKQHSQKTTPSLRPMNITDTLATNSTTANLASLVSTSTTNVTNMTNATTNTITITNTSHLAGVASNTETNQTMTGTPSPHDNGLSAGINIQKIQTLNATPLSNMTADSSAFDTPVPGSPGGEKLPSQNTKMNKPRGSRYYSMLNHLHTNKDGASNPNSPSTPGSPGNYNSLMTSHINRFSIIDENYTSDTSNDEIEMKSHPSENMSITEVAMAEMEKMWESDANKESETEIKAQYNPSGMTYNKHSETYIMYIFLRCLCCEKTVNK